MYAFRRVLIVVVPLVVIAAVFLVNRYLGERRYRQLQQRAQVTARIWLASAQHRMDPERFVEVRDSILAEYNLSLSQLNTYMSRYRERAEKYEAFTSLVKEYVDSLSAVGQNPADTVTDSSDSGHGTTATNE